MRFRLFSPPCSPIAIDFGSSALKLLQIGGEEKPPLLAAAEASVPDAIRGNVEERFAFYASALPKLIRKGGFKGRKVVCAVPSDQTMIQHMQLAPMEGVKRNDLILSELQVQVGLSPANTVIRSVDVTEFNRDGQSRFEVICFAIPRDIVMRYINLLEESKLIVAGVHTEVQAMIRAFDHIHRRKGDEKTTTMYIDLGWGSTRVAVAHGTQLVFARAIQIGGRHFDQAIAKLRRCNIQEARRIRQQIEPLVSSRTEPQPGHPASSPSTETGSNEPMGRLGPAMTERQQDAPSVAAAVERRAGNAPVVLPREVDPDSRDCPLSAPELREVLETMTDELSMCVRYHRSLFPGRPIDRIILLGGEARQPWLCQHIVRSLRIPARLADPLARFTQNDNSVMTGDLTPDQPQPGWAVPSGLCVAPTDM